MNKILFKKALSIMLSALMLAPMLSVGMIPTSADAPETDNTTETTAEADTEAVTDEAESVAETETAAPAETVEETEPAETAPKKPDLKGTGVFVGGYYTHEDTTIATSLYVPKSYTPENEYSLLIYFHNSGVRGSEPYMTGSSGNALMKNVKDLTNDTTIIFAPRCPEEYFWAQAPYEPGYYSYADTPVSKPMAAVISYLYDEIIAKYNIDMSRVWAFGDSLGGGATWDLMLREPDLLAAAVPTAGYNDPTQALNIRDDLAIWAFHTIQDHSVSYRGDHALTAILKNLGRNVKYTEYDVTNPEDDALFASAKQSSKSNWAHWAWDPAYKNMEVAKWMVVQKKADNTAKIETTFTDIAPTDKLYKAICYATNAGLFTGIDEQTFNPDGVMTRAMFVTVLGRAAGIDPAQYTGVTFTDVVAGAWYAPYVDWAASNGYVKGIGDNQFGINGEITIEEACTMLARFAEFNPAANTTGLTLDLYTDALAIHEWGKQGVEWAIENGIYIGSLASTSRLTVRNTASRALVASMFYNYTATFGTKTAK